MRILALFALAISLAGGASGAEPCPVVILHLESSYSAKAGLFAALAGAEASNTYLIIKYENRSSKLVTGVRFSIAYLNSVNEVAVTQDIATPVQKLRPNKSFQMISADDSITGGSKMALRGKVARVAFADGTSWDAQEGQTCMTLPGR